MYTSEKYDLKVSLQDVRVWGDDELVSSTGFFGSKGSIDLKEGWVRLKIDERNSVKLGRQIWNYADGRILSRRNWNQAGIAYDAFLYSFQDSAMQADIGLSFNNNIQSIFGNDYYLYETRFVFDSVSQQIRTELIPQIPKIKTLNFLYLKKGGNKVDLSFIGIAAGYQKREAPEIIYLTGTYGLIGETIDGNQKFTVAGYYQHGRNAAGMQVDAFMVNLDARFNTGKLSPGLGMNIISGQDQIRKSERYTEKDHFFDILYGARHGYYGLMDYFSNMRKATAGAGLLDIFGGLSWKLAEKHELMADYHYFAAHARVKEPGVEDPEEVLEKHLGSEIDLVYTFKLHDDITLNLGASTFLATEGLRKMQDVDPDSDEFSYWVWSMLTVKPTIFDQEKER